MLFDGRKFALEKEILLKEKLSHIKGTDPKMGLKLSSILIGDNPESELYLKLKGKAAARMGIDFELVRFNEECEVDEVVEKIKRLNQDPKVKGIMVQLPLPEKWEVGSGKLEILGSIEPRKDVDCLTSENLGLLMMGKPRFLPATVRAVLEILNVAQNKPLITNYQLLITERWLAGKNACIIGASEIVGKPLVMVLSELGATVTLCRSTTKNLAEFTKKADILVSATGVPSLVKKDMVKKGAVVVDVGISMSNVKCQMSNVRGDVQKNVAEVASFLTPVPGGVGPVTVVCLFENLLLASQGNALRS